MGVERCAQCGSVLLEDEAGVTRWWALGAIALCSHECVEAFKEAIRSNERGVASAAGSSENPNPAAGSQETQTTTITPKSRTDTPTPEGEAVGLTPKQRNRRYITHRCSCGKGVRLYMPTKRYGSSPRIFLDPDTKHPHRLGGDHYITGPEPKPTTLEEF